MLYRAYVDEAGDLGLSPASSRHLVLSAVIVSDADDARLRAGLSELRSALGRRPGQALHFVKLSHSQKLKAVQEIATSSLVTVVNAVVYKPFLPPARDIARVAGVSRPNSAYLSALRSLLWQISRRVAAGADDQVVVTFSQLKGLGAEKLDAYRSALEATDGVAVSWAAFHEHPFRIRGPRDTELLQLADITASAAFRAVEPDRFGNIEPRYLDELGPRVYGRSTTSCSPA